METVLHRLASNWIQRNNNHRHLGEKKMSSSIQYEEDALGKDRSITMALLARYLYREKLSRFFR